MNVAASHSGSLTSTELTTHGNCTKHVPGQPSSAFQISKVDMHAAMANRETMQTDIETE